MENYPIERKTLQKIVENSEKVRIDREIRSFCRSVRIQVLHNANQGKFDMRMIIPKDIQNYIKTIQESLVTMFPDSDIYIEDNAVLLIFWI